MVSKAIINCKHVGEFAAVCENILDCASVIQQKMLVEKKEFKYLVMLDFKRLGELLFSSVESIQSIQFKM